MSANVVGNYKVLDKIGEGGMGAVYKGVDMMLEREVAIKALRPELARQPHLVERFRAEAVTLAKLNHPNIATLHSFFRQAEEYYMVMEFVRGETLDKVLQRSGGMTCDWAIPLFCQALEGIDHAHRLGIVHRDIKPSNMMLTEAGSIKVMDFGIARVLGTARMTKQGNIIGTIEYMSPEQVRGKETDSRSDIYSLGILLYEMLTGRVPFNSNSEYELMRSQIEDSPTPPREFAPHVPLYVEEAIMRALAKRPEARFQTAGDFRRVLLGAKAVTSQLTARPSAQFAADVTREGQIRAPGELNRNSSTAFLGSVTQTGTADHMRNASLPGIGPDSREAASAQDPALKETRLPDAIAPAGPALGVAANHPVINSEPVQVQVPPGVPPAEGAAAPPASSKLSWKVFAAAGAVLVVFGVGAVILLASILLPKTNATKVSGATQTTAAPPPQPQVQQLQAEPVTSLTPGAALESPGQAQRLGGGAADDSKVKRTDRTGASGRSQGSSDTSEAAVGSPIVAPSAPAPTPPSQQAATTHPSSPARNPSSTSGRDTRQATASDTPKEEKKKGFFGKIKDKVSQPFKHDSDKKQE